MSLSFIKENEWDNENIESRIDNEARVLGIQNFNFSKCGLNLSFTGSLRLIDAIKIVYELEDSGFNMYKECKTVLGLSKSNIINMHFTINKDSACCIIPVVEINNDMSEEDAEHLSEFKSHIVLMLSIWKNAILKRWIRYFLDYQ
jgi:hypothetical protein